MSKNKLEKFARELKPWEEHPWGANIFGSMGGFSGLSDASRGVVASFKRVELPMKEYDFLAPEKVGELPYMINIVHANPNQLLELLWQLPEEQWKHHYNIGFWIWEQERLPKEWLPAMAMFDEFWVCSKFVAEAIRRETDKPVTVVPYVLGVEEDPILTRADFGLPEGMFLALVAFDCDSVPERKNPYGAICAFVEAFHNDEAGIVLKVRNLTDAVRSQIMEQLGERKNVYILEGNYPKKAVNSLIRCVDVYMSLHRAEGFGLVSAEAMYLGTPVIATNWSSTTEFMNDEVACLVDAKLIELDKNYPPYRKGSRWADPDIKQASVHLRKLYEDADFKKNLAKKAHDYISMKLSEESISGIIEKRMREIKEIVEREKL